VGDQPFSLSLSLSLSLLEPDLPDLLPVRVDGLHRNPEHLGDVGVAVSLQAELQHLLASR
jgi:hypothetical protein